jgi:hypothetical protein
MKPKEIEIDGRVARMGIFPMGRVKERCRLENKGFDIKGLG